MESNFNYLDEENVEKGKVFDVNKIKKYFKNQKSPSDLSTPFTDNIFPPCKNSLMSLKENGDPICPESYEQNASDLEPDNIEWKRVSEIIPDFLLFEDEIEFNDIKQGGLGNCYFLSALATLSDYPNLIYKIFKSKEESTIGFYEIAFFIDGEWNIVIIDDFIPTVKGEDRFAFAQPNGKEIWVLLIEKAWAKINGGYLNTIAGYPTDPFSAMTGFSKKHYYLESLKPDEVWKILMESFAKNYFIACSTSENTKNEENGIVSTHAYTLLSVKQYNHEGKNLKLLKIRNPHGCTEFNGDWSDVSDLWTDKLNKVFGHKINSEEDYDDGLFFICLEDFLKFYDQLYVCFPIYDSQVKSYLIGEKTSYALNQPHIFSLNIPRKSEVSLVANAPYWRYNRNLVAKNHPINILIAKVNEDKNILEFCDGDFSAVMDPVIRQNLKAGKYLVWVFLGKNDEDIRNINNYRFKICADCKFTCNYEKIDNEFKIFKEIVLSGIEQENKEEILSKESVEKSGQLKSTEINYCYVYNNTGAKYKYTMDASNLQYYSLINPYENKQEFTWYIANEEKRVFFALKKIHEEISFDMDYECFELPEDDEDCEEEENCLKTEQKNLFSKNLNFMDYVNKQKLDFTPEDDYYDYICPSKDEFKRKIDFANKQVEEYKKEECEEEYPDIMNKLFTFIDNKQSKENEKEENEEIESIEEDEGDAEEDDYLEQIGQKKIITENGTYIGEVDEFDNFCGNGVYIFETGAYYIGNFRDNVLNGEGEEYDDDGSLIYKGSYKMGEKSGKGILYYSDGSIYEGKLKNGIRNGKGVYTMADGDMYEGIYVNDIRHGKGTYFWSSGEQWQGKFKNDMLHGRGNYFDGNEYRVMAYKDNQPVEDW